MRGEEQGPGNHRAVVYLQGDRDLASRAAIITFWLISNSDGLFEHIVLLWF